MPDRHLLHDLDAEAFQRDNLARVIGQQANGVEAEIGKNLRADAVLVLKLPLAGFAPVVHELAGMRQHARPAIGRILGAEARPGFVQIDQHAVAFEGDGLERACLLYTSRCV